MSDEQSVPEEGIQADPNKAIPVPQQVQYGVSIFDVGGGPPVIHITPPEDGPVDLSDVHRLLYVAAQKIEFKLHVKAAMEGQMAAQRQQQGGIQVAKNMPSGL